MPLERLPRQATAARCPQCYQSFHFDPSAFQTEEPHQGATDTGACVTCPFCGLPRQIPAGREPAPQATLNCRRCGRGFRIDAGQRPPLAAAPTEPIRHLSGIGALLTDSWDLFCRRGWNLLAIYLLACLLIFTPLLLASIFLPNLVAGNQVLAWLCLLAGGIYGCFGFAWMTATLFQQVVKPHLPVRQAAALGCQNLGKFTWLLLLLYLTIGGGSLLLLLPGILFSIWFFFSQYILAEEGTGGIAALEKSHQLVRGHWWAVFFRLFLLLLVAGAISTLTSRLPLIGTTVNFALTLLLTPFSLLYGYRVYQDLKRCRPAGTPPAASDRRWLYLSLPILGWLVLPALLIFASNQNLQNSLLTDDNLMMLSELAFNPATSLPELIEEQGATPPPTAPERLSAEDYQRLLSQRQLTAPTAHGVSLGPASLQSRRFWANAQAPQLELRLTLAPLPNLGLAPRRAVRIQIDQITDNRGQDLYNHNHSFESADFQWVAIRSDSADSDAYCGTRNIHLQPGTAAGQINSISGTLELHLPLAIESVSLTRSDIGKTIQVAGKHLTLTGLDEQKISLSFQGDSSALLDLQAVDAQQQQLRGSGGIWQTQDQRNELQQLFSGRVERLTIHVAGDFMVRSLPFTISR